MTFKSPNQRKKVMSGFNKSSRKNKSLPEANNKQIKQVCIVCGKPSKFVGLDEKIRCYKHLKEHLSNSKDMLRRKGYTDFHRVKSR